MACNNRRENASRISHDYKVGDKVLLKKTGNHIRKIEAPRTDAHCWGYSVSPGLLQFPGLRITPYWRYQTMYLRTLYCTHLVSVPTYAHHHRLARP
jgi:hypothetical protein